ncbi:hypothetical protein MASR2M41_11630 [Flammeovirgaceae bacterium]
MYHKRVIKGKVIMTKNIKIVTVEDSTIVVNRLNIMLGALDGANYMGNVTTVASAKLLINSIQPDVVILDIHLAEDAPHANGITLLPWLKENHPQLIIIMLTNQVEPHYRNTCNQCGAHYFLDKSKEFDKVAQVITESMSSKCF